MMWSCTAMPSGVAIAMIALIIWISACDGVGSPLGWLCTTITEQQRANDSAAVAILTTKNSVVVSIDRKAARCQNNPCTDCEILRLHAEYSRATATKWQPSASVGIGGCVSPQPLLL